MSFPIFNDAPKSPTEGDGYLNQVFKEMDLALISQDRQGSVVVINSDVSVAEAACILGANQCLSAPIYDVNQPSDAAWTQKYVGIVDFLSIVNWLMDATWGHSPDSLDQLRHLKRRFQTTPVCDIVKHARASPFIPIDTKNNTFLDVMLLLGKYEVRRVFAVNSTGGDITGVISQSAVVECIAHHLDELSYIANKEIGSLGLGTPTQVIAVGLEDTYWDAFRAIHHNVINSVPILDDEGKLIGNVSARDLKNMILEPAKFAVMAHPIGEFLIHGLDLFTCKTTDTVGTVVKKFQASHVHALYVVDSERRVTSVVALCDLLAIFVKESDADFTALCVSFDRRLSSSQ